MNRDYFKRHSKNRDELTKLYRRDVISGYMENLIHDGCPFTFAIIDIDNFKTINDSYGHQMGDTVLRMVAEILEKLVKNTGVIGRYGGDEFIFVFPNIVEYDDVWQQLFNILQSPYTLKIGDTNIRITFTIGASRYPLDTTNIDQIFNLADKALYRGKIKGRNCFIIYLKEKHGDINLQTIREKVYEPINLHSKIYNMLTKTEDIKSNIKSVIDFVGAYLLIDHICIEKNDKLYYEYYQPISKNRGCIPYGNKNIKDKLDSDGVYYINVVTTIDNELLKSLLDQKVYSTVLCELKCHNKHYGYLRCDMTNVNTGRVWQAEDLVLIKSLASQMSLVLYINSLTNKLKKEEK